MMTTEQLLASIELKRIHEELIERSTITSHIEKDRAKDNIVFLNALEDKLVELEEIRLDYFKLRARVEEEDCFEL